MCTHCKLNCITVNFDTVFIGGAGLDVIRTKYPKSLRVGPSWCVASAPLPNGPNTGSNPREGRVLKKIKKKLIFAVKIRFTSTNTFF